MKMFDKLKVGDAVWTSTPTFGVIGGIVTFVDTKFKYATVDIQGLEKNFISTKDLFTSEDHANINHYKEIIEGANQKIKMHEEKIRKVQLDCANAHDELKQLREKYPEEFV